MTEDLGSEEWGIDVALKDGVEDVEANDGVEGFEPARPRTQQWQRRPPRRRR